MDVQWKRPDLCMLAHMALKMSFLATWTQPLIATWLQILNFCKMIKASKNSSCIESDQDVYKKRKKVKSHQKYTQYIDQTLES